MKAGFIASLEQLHRILAWICGQLQGMDPPRLRKVELACEEALVNIIHHAYQDQPQRVEIEVSVFPEDRAEILFRDWGPPFDPLQQRQFDLSSGWEERELGGLGIPFIRSLIDEVRYRREGECNVLQFLIPIRSSRKR